MSANASESAVAREMNRIVVFTGDLSFSVRKGIVQIDRAVGGLDWLIVLHSPPKNPRQLIRNQWRNLRRNGWRWLPYQAGDIRRRLLSRAPAASPTRGPGREYSLSALHDNPRIRLLVVADIHAATSLDAVREFHPRLGLSLAAPILKRALFS